MSKLYRLKSWLSVPETAQHLSRLFEEEVTEADVLGLCLDGHLTLSLRLVSDTFARPWVRVHRSELRFREAKSIRKDHPAVQLTEGGPLWQPEWLRDPDTYLQLKKHLTTLGADVWDLPMEDAARLCVLHEYQRLVGGLGPTDVSLDGIVVRSLTGDLYQLQEHFEDNPYYDEKNLKRPYTDPSNFYPAARLPHNDFSALAVRTSAISDLIEKLERRDEPKAEQHLTTRERQTLYKLVIGMAVGGYAYRPEAQRNDVMGEIVQDLQSAGVPLSDETIRKYLKEAAQVLPRLGND